MMSQQREDATCRQQSLQIGLSETPGRLHHLICSKVACEVLPERRDNLAFDLAAFEQNLEFLTSKQASCKLQCRVLLTSLCAVALSCKGL